MLVVPPFRLVTVLGHFVEIAHEVIGVEMVILNPRQDRHILVFQAELNINTVGLVSICPRYDLGDQYATPNDSYRHRKS
jgi:hypothetical protein